MALLDDKVIPKEVSSEIDETPKDVLSKIDETSRCAPSKIDDETQFAFQQTLLLEGQIHSKLNIMADRLSKITFMSKHHQVVHKLIYTKQLSEYLLKLYKERDEIHEKFPYILETKELRGYPIGNKIIVNVERKLLVINMSYAPDK